MMIHTERRGWALAYAIWYATVALFACLGVLYWWGIPYETFATSSEWFSWFPFFVSGGVFGFKAYPLPFSFRFGCRRD